MLQYVYLVFQAATNASHSAAFMVANTLAVCHVPVCRLFTIWSAISFQCPPGEYVPGPSSQKNTACCSAGVAFAHASWTVWSSLMNCCDP